MGEIYEGFLELPALMVPVGTWLIDVAPLAGARWRCTYFGRCRHEERKGNRRARYEGPLTPWKVIGSRGLDTWFELPAGYAIGDIFGGEPGGCYDYSSLIEEYLATLAGEEAPEGYHAWLEHELARWGAREEG